MSDVLQLVNGWWRNGSRESSSVIGAGILVRHFDKLSRAREWEPCAAGTYCERFNEIWPSTLINRRHNTDLYAEEDVGGFVLAPPPLNRLRCAYPLDANSFGQPSELCQRRCAVPPQLHSKNPRLRCSFPPERLAHALYVSSMRKAHNEMAIDTAHMRKHLPHSLLAVFHMGSRSRLRASAVHVDYLRAFNLSRNAFPFLRFSRSSGFQLDGDKAAVGDARGRRGRWRRQRAAMPRAARHVEANDDDDDDDGRHGRRHGRRRSVGPKVEGRSPASPVALRVQAPQPPQAPKHACGTPGASCAAPLRKLWLFWDKGEEHLRSLSDRPRHKYRHSWRCLNYWRQLNVGVDVVLLNDTAAAALSPEYRALRDRAPTYKHKVQQSSDVLRLDLLSQRGGVWADITTCPVRSLQDWSAWMSSRGFFAFHGRHGVGYGRTQPVTRGRCTAPKGQQSHGGRRPPFPRAGSFMVDNWLLIAREPHHYVVDKWLAAYSAALWRLTAQTISVYHLVHCVFTQLYLDDASFRHAYDRDPDLGYCQHGGNAVEGCARPVAMDTSPDAAKFVYKAAEALDRMDWSAYDAFVRARTEGVAVGSRS